MKNKGLADMYTTSKRLAFENIIIKAIKIMPKDSEDIKFMKPILREPNLTNLIVET